MTAREEVEARKPFADELQGEELAGIEAEALEAKKHHGTIMIPESVFQLTHVHLDPDFALRFVSTYRKLQGEVWGRAIKQFALESRLDEIGENAKYLDKYKELMLPKLRERVARILTLAKKG